jgi:hypothetical protein
LLAGLALLAWFVLSSRWNVRSAKARQRRQLPQSPRQRENERWRSALEVDAVVGYRAFLEDFPASAHREQAPRHIDMLENIAWESVVAEGTGCL